jgi:hypothetical protein
MTSGPRKDAISVLEAIYIHALVFWTIWPFFSDLAIWNVINPIASNPSAILMHIYSIAICLIFKPFSFINLSIMMNKAAPTVHMIFVDLTLVFAALGMYD